MIVSRHAAGCRSEGEASLAGSKGAVAIAAGGKQNARLATDEKQDAGMIAVGESGRRRSHPRRPPTPPGMRFRTGRFMK